MRNGIRYNTFVLIILFITTTSAIPRPAYDHQSTLYKPHFPPLNLINYPIKYKPIVSPYYGIADMVQIIDDPNYHIRSLQIYTPSFSSWSYNNTHCAPFNSSCTGCDVNFVLNNEQFPLFKSLINLGYGHEYKHKQTSPNIQIITNDYNTHPCNQQIDLLTALHIHGGIKIRYYRSTTFMHSKVLLIERANRKTDENEYVTIISSINFSHTSFMKNRELGLIMIEHNNHQIYDYVTNVFDDDWNRGYDFTLNQSYSPSVIDSIQRLYYSDVVIPNRISFNNCDPYYRFDDYVDQPLNITLYVSPDSSHDQLYHLLDSLNDTVSSHITAFNISIYQITDQEFVNYLIDRNGIFRDKVHIYVSHYVYDQHDRTVAEQMYGLLEKYGYKVTKSKDLCLTFSHQKYMLIEYVGDGDITHCVAWISTGNISPSDIPNMDCVERYGGFPPYDSHVNCWQPTNRDFNIIVHDDSSSDPTLFDQLSKLYQFDVDCSEL